jgi:hypothetical protein
MTRVTDRQRAIELRKKGRTYSEIKQELNIPKSTLSGWLSKFPLTAEQIINITKSSKINKFLGIEKTRITKQRRREERLGIIYEAERKRWQSLTKRELELAGLFLYWGEGKKNLKSALAINNTDPQVVKFALLWIIKALKVPKNKIKIELHLYSDMDTVGEISFWAKTLNVPIAQFYKPYIKKSTRASIDHKGFGHGTCGIVVNDVRLKEKVMMGIRAITENIEMKHSL